MPVTATTSPAFPMCQSSKVHHKPSLIRNRQPDRDQAAVLHVLPRAGKGSCSWIPCRQPRQRRHRLCDALSREHDGLQPRPAHLIDRQRGDVISEAASQCGLTCRRLTEPRRDDVAHDAFLDDGRVDAGARNGLTDHDGAELWGSERLQRSEELAGCGSSGGNNDNATPLNFTGSVNRRAGDAVVSSAA